MRDPLLDDRQRREVSGHLPEWTMSTTTLSREVTATTFAGAIAWVVAIADAAETLDHHPDIDIRWRTLRLVLTTHDSGGITGRDAALAQRIDEIVRH